MTCACGCGGATRPARQTDRVKGWIAGQPIRFVRGHHLRLPRPERRRDPIERLMALVEKAEGGCWEWLGGKTSGGYGHWAIGERGVMAHRAAYELLRGPISSGLTLDHLCRNRACVNPDHLDPVPIGENLRRGDTLNARNIAKSHCKRGHPFDGQNTYVFGNGFRQCKACARMHSKNYQKRKRLMTRQEPEA